MSEPRRVGKKVQFVCEKCHELFWEYEFVVDELLFRVLQCQPCVMKQLHEMWKKDADAKKIYIP